jgi:hypothetical protein
MQIINRLAHPGWVGVVLPLGLAIGSTFTPGTWRGALLIAAIVAVAWTIHNTEFGGKNWRRTGIAVAIATVIAIGVFFIGRIVDARPKPKESAVVMPAPSPPLSVVEKNVTSNLGQTSADKPKRKPNRRTVTAPAPPPATNTDKSSIPPSAGTSTGPVVVQPGAVASFGQQGGQTAGTIINSLATAPELDVTDVQDNKLNLAGLYETKYKIKINSQFTIGKFAVKVSTKSGLESLVSLHLNPDIMRVYQGEGPAINGIQIGTPGSPSSGRYAAEAIIAMVGDAVVVVETKIPETFNIEFFCAPVQCSLKRLYVPKPSPLGQSPK